MTHNFWFISKQQISIQSVCVISKKQISLHNIYYRKLTIATYFGIFSLIKVPLAMHCTHANEAFEFCYGLYFCSTRDSSFSYFFFWRCLRQERVKYQSIKLMIKLSTATNAANPNNGSYVIS